MNTESISKDAIEKAKGIITDNSVEDYDNPLTDIVANKERLTESIAIELTAANKRIKELEKDGGCGGVNCGKCNQCLMANLGLAVFANNELKARCDDDAARISALQDANLTLKSYSQSIQAKLDAALKALGTIRKLSDITYDGPLILKAKMEMIHDQASRVLKREGE